MKTTIIAVGKASNSFYAKPLSVYQKRISPAPDLIEIEIKSPASPQDANIKENQKILDLIPDNNFCVALDSSGTQLSSQDFTKKISEVVQYERKGLCFVIGGSDGLGIHVKKRADMLLSFGKQTWPHLLARVMLLEQIYRAQQILAGHPYHK